MTSEQPPPSDAGPDPLAGASGPLPFSVTGPGDLVLPAARVGTTTFTVTNLTGRPVRVRLQPKADPDAHSAWYRLTGDPEVAMTVGATISVDVKATVPADAPAGKDTLRLRAVDEADPERVTDGQAVTVTIPEAPAKQAQPPFLLIGLVAFVLLLAGGGAVWWFLLRTPPVPLVSTGEPVITGQARTGAVLTTTDGDWTGAPNVDVQWSACPTPTTCVPIAGATGRTFQVTGAEVGTRLKVTATATSGNTSATNESTLTAVVVAAVPNLVGVSVGESKRVLTSLQLNPVVINDPSGSSCSVVTATNPGNGASASKGATVQLTVTFQKCAVVTFKPPIQLPTVKATK